MSSDWIDEARRGEAALLDPDTRADGARVAALLDADFAEVGSSGRRWSRAEVIEALGAEAADGALVATEMSATKLSETVVLLTYRCRRAGRETWRSSIWRLEQGACRMVFHQATPIAESFTT